VLGLDGEVDGLLLAEIVAGPEPVEKVEAELASQRLLDHLAVGSSGPGGAHLDGSQHVLVDRQRGARLGYIRIIAS